MFMLKHIREKLKLSKEKVGSDVGVSSRTVENWENETTDPAQMSFESAVKLAECYDISIEQLWNIVTHKRR